MRGKGGGLEKSHIDGSKKHHSAEWLDAEFTEVLCFALGSGIRRA